MASTRLPSLRARQFLAASVTWLGRAGAAAVLLGSIAMAGCTASPAPVSGYVFDHVTAAIAPGFHGTGTFACDTVAAVTVSGSGAAIAAAVAGSTAVPLRGGPLAYSGPGGTLTFQPDYAGLVWDRPADALPLACSANAD